ncbi:hypothetical protein HYQ44_015100 [Verticillium longisporum]|nr:hypothetical protein HYQ44_015100 [Verticillium longisporum]
MGLQGAWERLPSYSSSYGDIIGIRTQRSIALIEYASVWLLPPSSLFCSHQLQRLGSPHQPRRVAFRVKS